ncbi:TetR/AcrR family transcriptional regulator [Marinobacterium arenosum]|uniref:TetR/AcrR family transcriptional regulator n=1 Tax=Marinobacterium arenosum TaxID=2862496 RepID=UPI001C988991|nr:TetR/AcrR family transcriptional regulator [Marinobacterium arenosum]MBY4678449.1 TetR/AcrR family transcriptional regulator [Marinobacterium arenosum]
MMARRNDHSRDELQQMALQAAERLLDEQGAEALSTRKIAAAIGYSVGSLYQLFRNYDDLCWQINSRTLQQLLQALAPHDGKPPREALKAYALGYLQFAGQQPQRWSLLFEHRSPAELATPVELDGAIAQLFGLIEQPLAALLPEQPAQEIELAARTLWSGVHGVAVLSSKDKLFHADPGSAGRMVTDLIDRYLDGWRG